MAIIRNSLSCHLKVWVLLGICDTFSRRAMWMWLGNRKVFCLQISEIELILWVLLCSWTWLCFILISLGITCACNIPFVWESMLVGFLWGLIPSESDQHESGKALRFYEGRSLKLSCSFQEVKVFLSINHSVFQRKKKDFCRKMQIQMGFLVQDARIQSWMCHLILSLCWFNDNF